MDQRTNEFGTQNKGGEAVGKLREFCSETSAHGFGRLASSSSTIERFLWSACLLAALGYMTYQGISLVSDYMSYPVDVKVELKYSDTLDFPAVVVCNMNTVKRSGLNKAMQQGLITNIDQWRGTSLNDSREYMSSLKYAFLASLNTSVKHFIGHQADDFIVACYWNGEACGPKNFTFLYNFVYGNCYVFSEKDDVKNISVPGSENGLSLVLNIEADEYLGDFSESYGAVVDVTSSNEMHFPEENGYLVAPGQVTNVALTGRVVKRLGQPYEGKDCGFVGRELIYKKRAYSETACRKTCAAENQLKLCGCAEVAYPVEPNCDPFNSTQADCVNHVADQIRLGKRKCRSCVEDCIMLEYPATVSSAMWPTSEYLSRLRNNLGDRASNVMSDLTEARRNLARVDVYYKSMTVEEISQEPRYKAEDLISNIGGSLGLFTGVSLLTLLEFCKLLFDLMRYFCRKHPSTVNPPMSSNEVNNVNEKEPEKKAAFY